MQSIINETEKLAYTYLETFGFPNDSIDRLIKKGKIDLENELDKLKLFMEEDPISLAQINDSLHALKGLLFQLGNTSLAEQLNEIHAHIKPENDLESIRRALNLI